MLQCDSCHRRCYSRGEIAVVKTHQPAEPRKTDHNGSPVQPATWLVLIWGDGYLHAAVLDLKKVCLFPSVCMFTIITLNCLLVFTTRGIVGSVVMGKYGLQMDGGVFKGKSLSGLHSLNYQGNVFSLSSLWNLCCHCWKIVPARKRRGTSPPCVGETGWMSVHPLVLASCKNKQNFLFLSLRRPNMKQKGFGLAVPRQWVEDVKV